MTLLAAEGLVKRFAGRRSVPDMLRGRPRPVVHAVEQVSLTVAAGEILGVVGESGCGKSTLARCLVGLDRPDAGTIRFDGAEVGRPGSAGRQAFHRAVQMVFQDPYGSLNPRMTVAATLAEPLAVHGIVPPAQIVARVAELLELVHLRPEAGARYPHEFSGGQRQRIGIARALAMAPRLIVADEPVSALDVSVQAAIVNLFLELQARLDLALVFITHDLRLVAHLTQRVAVMYLGRIVEEGPTATVFAAPRHPYTQALLSAVPHLHRKGQRREAAVRGELPSPLAPPTGCPFHPRCPLAEPRCSAVRPVLALRDGPSLVACHLAGEVGAGV